MKTKKKSKQTVLDMKSLNNALKNLYTSSKLQGLSGWLPGKYGFADQFYGIKKKSIFQIIKERHFKEKKHV